MDWQEITALAIVVLTAGLMLRCWRRSRKHAGCGGGCDCGKQRK